MMQIIKKVYRRTYKTFFSKYDVLIEKEIKDCKTLLDVGCGSYSPVKYFNSGRYCVGVDTFEPSIEESKKKKIHNAYFHLNVLDINKQFEKNSFDAVIALDVIEHLEKEDGYKLMEKMENIAAKKIIFYTPNGFLEQGDRFNNPWQVHYSGWEAHEFQEKGYKVIGINGMKQLRGKYAKPKIKPNLLGGFISDLTEFSVYNTPEKAFQLLAIKTKKNP